MQCNAILPTGDPEKVDADYSAFIESATKVLKEGVKKTEDLNWKDGIVMLESPSGRV
ncbi:MAG: hypothetical protein PVF37_09900 [Desulfobacterales bacterium]|jgi:hypothetical protein